MQRMLQIALAASLVLSSSAMAGTCDEVFSNIHNWLAGDGHRVRLASTFHRDDGDVAYTNGYLGTDASFPNFLSAPSIRYIDDSVTPGSPFNTASSDHVTIQILQSNPDAAQINYKIDNDPGASVAYSGQCHGNIINVFTPEGGALTLGFRFDSPE